MKNRRSFITLAGLVLVSCVTRTQVCVHVDRARLGRDRLETGESAGASVCVDLEKP